MQNIDFNRAYRKAAQQKIVKQRAKNRKLPVVGGIILFSFVIGLTIGISFQKHLVVQNDEKITTTQNTAEQNLTTSNINHDINKNIDVEEKSQTNIISKENNTTKESNYVKENIKSNVKINLENFVRKKNIRKKKELINTKKDSYLILARKYNSVKEASRAGLKLQEAGYKVFLSKNRNKMKLWIGPIQGRKKANLVMLHLSKIRSFKNAIMYKK